MEVLDANEFVDLVKSVQPVKYAKTKILGWVLAFLIFIVLPNAIMWSGKDNFEPGSMEIWLSVGFHGITLVLASVGFCYYVVKLAAGKIRKAVFLKLLFDYWAQNRLGYELRYHEYEDGTSWTDLVNPKGVTIARHYKESNDDYIHMPGYNKPGLYASINLSSGVGVVANPRAKDKQGSPAFTTKASYELSVFTPRLFFIDSRENMLRMSVDDMLEQLMRADIFNLESIFDKHKGFVEKANEREEHRQELLEESVRFRSETADKVADLESDKRYWIMIAKILFGHLTQVDYEIAQTSRLKDTKAGLQLHGNVLKMLLSFTEDERGEYHKISSERYSEEGLRPRFDEIYRKLEAKDKKLKKKPAKVAAAAP
jgi:hypothetical protein